MVVLFLPSLLLCFCHDRSKCNSDIDSSVEGKEEGCSPRSLLRVNYIILVTDGAIASNSFSSSPSPSSPSSSSCSWYFSSYSSSASRRRWCGYWNRNRDVLIFSLSPFSSSWFDGRERESLQVVLAPHTDGDARGRGDTDTDEVNHPLIHLANYTCVITGNGEWIAWMRRRLGDKEVKRSGLTQAGLPH